MGKKGSQLKAFKESLRAVTKPSGRKRNRKQFGDKDPDRTEKLKRIEEQFNAFDTKFTRLKHDVFGRKVKGKVGRPGINKEASEQTRKLALVKERQKRQRAGAVIDKRFGENDPDMDPEEKMLERFAMEKQSRARNSTLYNLEDNDQLTHYGQSLAELDDFDQRELLDVSDDDGDIKEDVVRQDHFGGNFEADSDNENESTEHERTKTKAEVMSELIQKSKAYKFERQQQHDEDLEEIEALDAELGELQGLLRTIQPSKAPRPQKTQEMLSYDAAIREMIYDKRSKPTERTKTEEEIAQEESERLQKLEEERLRRMRGEEMEVVETGPQKSKTRREGDDLDDDFVVDEGEEDLYGFGKGALIDGSDIEEEGSEVEDEIEGENGEIEEGEDEDSDEEAFEDDDDFDLAQYFTDEEQEVVQELESDKEDAIIPATKRLKIGESTSTSQEIAFTYPCPSTFAEMLGIIKDVPVESIPTVIERIEILHSTKLRAENREKLETFTPIVLRLILHLAAIHPIPFNAITDIIARLHGLATQFPSALTQEIFSAIEGSRKRLASSLTSDKIFPTAQELVLFYTIGQIYPPSDLSHPIIDPTTLFMGQILSQMRIKSVQDLGRGMFICSLFLQYQSLAKRLAPEVVNFINYTLVTLTSVEIDNLPETRAEQDTKHLRLKTSEIPKAVAEKLSFSSLLDKSPNEAQLKIQLLKMALELANSAADLWKSVISLPELFQPTQTILTEIKNKKIFKALPESLQSRYNTILDTISRRIKLSLGSRAALTLQAHRPIPIPSYLPKFSMNYSLDSKNDPNHQRAALSKLKHHHRREKKSVIRELRKEARTEAVVRSEEGRRKDAVYQEKLRVATGIMKAGNDVGKWQRDQKRKRR